MRSLAYFFPVIAALHGCAANHSIQHLQEPAPQVLRPMADETARLSSSSASSLENLREQLERPAAPSATSEQTDNLDAMAGKPFTLSMQNATAAQLLWILADRYQLGLSIEPGVLESSQRANLYLKNVSGRTAMEQIAKTFDISVEMVPGNVLVATRTQEKVFDLEMLIGSTSVEVLSGGDVFGSGAAQNSKTLQDSVSVRGTIGDKTDAFESLKTSLDSVLDDGSEKQEKGINRYAIDRNIGSLYVKATPSKMRAIERIIQERKAYRKTQIQVDAQLIDVRLNDASQFGIDWNIFSGRVLGQLGGSPVSVASASALLQGASSLPTRSLTFPAQSVGVAGGGGGLTFGNSVYSATINALLNFGSVRLLSNPTIRMRNGVPAFLSVGTSYRYVQKITANSQLTAGGSASSVDVVTDSVFSGIVISVGAKLKQDGTIELFIRPSQTDVDATSLQLQDVGGGNKVSLPVVATKSMVTTLSLRDGDTVVIGGLISQQASGSDAGVPGLSEIPWLGKLFTRTARDQQARELVMVLKARLI